MLIFNKKRIPWILVTLSIVFSLFYIVNNEKSVSSDPNIELSLKEAINLGVDKAKEWNKNSYLTFITSVDEDMGGTRGTAGKRYNWNLVFESSDKSRQLFIGIVKGEITGVRERNGPSFGEIKLSDINFDSPDLIKIAKKKYDLQKGVDWATGYHFTIDGEKVKPTITVLGNDKNGLFTRISFSIKNGEVVNARHKVPIGGGIIKTHLGSEESEVSKRGMAIKGISANYNQVVVWGDQQPRVFNLSVQPFVEFSRNGGGHWRAINLKQDILNAWINIDNDIYATTELEIWHIKDTENIMNRIFVTENIIEKIDYSPNNNIVVLSNNYIYKTIDNGKNWSTFIHPESDKVISLQISDEGTVVILTSNGKVFLNKNDKWINLELANGLESPTHMELIEDNLFLLSNYTLWVQNLKDDELNKVQTKYEFNKLIKNGKNLFGTSEDGIIYLVKPEGYANEWKVEKLFQVKEGIITDLELTQNDFFIATIPDYDWESIN